MENQSNTIDEKEQKRLRFSGNKKTQDFLESLNLPFNFERVQGSKSPLSLDLLNDEVSLRFMGLSSSISVGNISLLTSTLSSLLIAEGSKEQLNIDTKLSFNNVSSISHFLSHYRSFDLFKSYSHAQLIYHINGEGEAYSHTLNLRGTIQSKLSVSDFNNLFTKIKKSKNKVFNQTDLQLDIVNSVGAFLAKELITPEFSFIILISRNDIFNPTDKEIELFEQITLINKFLASQAIRRDITSRHSKLINSIIENFPIDISYDEDSHKISVNHSSFNEESDYHLERLELMGELLNTLRHELSNPLFGINISSGLLKTDSHKKDEIYLETIDEIANSSKRCQNILENFTNLYDTKDSIKEFKLIDLVKETIVLTKSESKFFRPEIIADNNIKDYVIESNPTLLSQVIFNLIVNSSQALRNYYEDNTGKITIYLKKEEEIVIDVVDNGPGVPDEIHDLMFKPFVTTKEKGTGLGLTICKNITQKLGGDLSYSKLKNGASFTIRINNE